MKLSANDHERIRAATSKAETQTNVRFAVVIVPTSDRYAHYPLIWGAAFALMIGAALSFLSPALSIRYAILIELAAFVTFALFFDWRPLRLLLAPKRAKHLHARNLAHREFAARILSPGDHRDGLLFFVSLAERYVEILATRDIHSKVGNAAWNAIVTDFVAAAKNGHIAGGAISATEACSHYLLSPSSFDLT